MRIILHLYPVHTSYTHTLTYTLEYENLKVHKHDHLLRQRFSVSSVDFWTISKNQWKFEIFRHNECWFSISSFKTYPENFHIVFVEPPRYFEIRTSSNLETENSTHTTVCSTTKNTQDYDIIKKAVHRMLFVRTCR